MMVMVLLGRSSLSFADDLPYFSKRLGIRSEELNWENQKNCAKIVIRSVGRWGIVLNFEMDNRFGSYAILESNLF